MVSLVSRTASSPATATATGAELFLWDMCLAASSAPTAINHGPITHLRKSVASSKVALPINTTTVVKTIAPSITRAFEDRSIRTIGFMKSSTSNFMLEHYINQLSPWAACALLIAVVFVGFALILTILLIVGFSLLFLFRRDRS